MKQSTITYALHVLDQQLEHMSNRRTDEQEAYYHGMLLMFNILVSNGCKNNTCARYDDNGIHYISDK